MAETKPTPTKVALIVTYNEDRKYKYSTEITISIDSTVGFIIQYTKSEYMLTSTNPERYEAIGIVSACTFSCNHGNWPKLNEILDTIHKLKLIEPNL